MSRKANPTVIGAFVVGALALAVAAVLILAGDQLFRQDRSSFVMYFHGSVKGLNIGSPVMFRGVNIGTVTSIQLVVNDENARIDIPVIVEIDNTRFIHDQIEPDASSTADEWEEMNRLIEAGLRAQLELQSLLTGQLLIQLDFLPGSPVNLVKDEKYTSRYPEVPTLPTPIEKLGEVLKNFPLKKVMEHVVASTEGIDKLVNSPILKESIASLHDALADLKSLVDKLDRAIDPMTRNTNALLTDAHATLKNVDKAVTDASAALIQAEKTFKTTEELVGDDQLENQLNQALSAISAAARAIERFADMMERHPESLMRGRQ